MKTWTRLKTVASCGACGQYIPAGTVLCLITVPDRHRPLVRCTTCAPPPDEKENP